MTRGFEIFLTMALLAFAAFAFASCAPAIRPPAVRGSQVIGGLLVPESDAMARSTTFVISANHASGDLRICSGSLIASDLVVTAAHCLVDSNSVRLPATYQTYVIFKTIVGVFDPNYLAGAFAIPYAQAISHPTYSRADLSLSNDIALLRLPQPAPATALPVAILQDGASLKREGTLITLAGFGISTADGSIEKKNRRLPASRTCRDHYALLRKNARHRDGDWHPRSPHG